VHDGLLGSLFALGAAGLWAVGSVIWARLSRVIPALELNLLKISLALVFFGLVLGLGGLPWPQFSGPGFGLLLLSGLVGIGLADTCYMVALRQLGARRALLLKTLDPPCAAVLSAMFLGETLGIGAWAGIALTLAGVAWVIRERTGTGQAAPTPFGLLCGLLAALGQAVGAVLTRAAFVATDIDPAWGVAMRLTGGLAVVLLWMGLRREPLFVWRSKPQAPVLFAQVVGAAFLATFVGIWLQQNALKLTAAGVAQTLSATSPLFVLPIAGRLGEPVSRRAVLGALLSVAGVALLLVAR